MSFLGEVLDKASAGSLADLKTLPEIIEKFIASVPETVKTCL